MRHLLAAAALLVVSGCASSVPTLAGGKPVSYWVEALKGPDVHLRKQAASKLGNVGSADESALPALLGGLKDSDAGVRAEVIKALAKHGPAAREAVPTLTEMHERDHSPQVRELAGRALEKLRSEG